jgi:hypothetical protein
MLRQLKLLLYAKENDAASAPEILPTGLDSELILKSLLVPFVEESFIEIQRP